MIDEETGVDASARDGEPGAGLSQAAKDELARKRAEREGNGQSTGEGRGIDDQNPDELEPGTNEDADGQLFVWEQGRKVTLSTLFDRRTPVEHAFVFTAKRTRGSGGLMALDEQPVLVVRGLAGPVKIVPTHDDDGKVTKVVIENHVVTQMVVPAHSEQGAALAGPIIDDFRAASAA